MHLQKLITTFYKKYPKKLTTVFLFLDSTPPMARLIILKKPKQKRAHPSKGVNKRSKS